MKKISYFILHSLISFFYCIMFFCYLNTISQYENTEAAVWAKIGSCINCCLSDNRGRGWFSLFAWLQMKYCTQKIQSETLKVWCKTTIHQPQTGHDQRVGQHTTVLSFLFLLLSFLIYIHSGVLKYNKLHLLMMFTVSML